MRRLRFPVDRWFALSLIGHAVLGALLVSVKFGGTAPGFLVVAGPGGQGGGGGSALSVELITEGELAKLFPPLAAAGLTEEPGPLTAPVHQVHSASDQPEIVLPDRSSPPPPRALRTERPVTSRPVRLWTGQQHAGGPTSPSALVGPTLPTGSSSVTVGGWGSGEGLGSGSGAGIPGGSDYGRRLQQALVSYYRLNPSTLARFVQVRVRIARTGRILSIQNGRLDPAAFILRSGNPIVDSRVEAALLELDRNPIPFPPDFLPGVREAVAEIYFRY